MVTAKLICVFVFAYAKIRFSHVTAQMMAIFYPLSEYLHIHETFKEDQKIRYFLHKYPKFSIKSYVVAI